MNPIDIELFNALHAFADHAEGRALYLLALICLAMIVDFIIGSLAAWRNPSIKFSSQAGIDGILRKLASILVLAICIPVTALIPIDAGLLALDVLYAGYLILELASIIENLDNLGVPVAPLHKFIQNFKEESDK